LSTARFLRLVHAGEPAALVDRLPAVRSTVRGLTVLVGALTVLQGCCSVLPAVLVLAGLVLHGRLAVVMRRRLMILGCLMVMSRQPALAAAFGGFLRVKPMSDPLG